MSFTPGLLPREPIDRRFLKAHAGGNYVVPVTVDLRPQLLDSSDQGSTSMCAAYAMAGWLEHYNWKYKGVATQIDPAPIYARAKQLDGYPNVEGTRLDCVLQAAQDLSLLMPLEVGSVREVGLNDVEQALHRYGVILSAFRITDQWDQAAPNGWIPEGGTYVGGHAVLLCGYALYDPPWYAFQNSWGTAQGWRGFNRVSPALMAQQFDYGLVWDLHRSS